MRVGSRILVGLPLVAYLATGAPIGLRISRSCTGFNFRGGFQIQPEFLALILGAHALHRDLHRRDRARRHPGGQPRPDGGVLFARPPRAAATLRLVVIPQAMRVIIPPLTSQYLNLTKNSSLAVPIGYPDLVAVFSGTVLNQTGQAVEVHRHDHGGLPDAQPADVALHELVQPRMALVER